jgi:hypothetical protein
MDPESLHVSDASQVQSGSLEIVVPYTSDEMTAKVILAATTMTRGLDATLKLVAVYVAPYPAELRCPAAVERHLTGRLTGLASRTSLPACVHIVVSRDRGEGFRQILRPGSAVRLDVAYVAISILCFAVGWAFVKGCDRL